VRFAVYETRYAIYPQHSGKLTFSPMIFEGRVNRNSNSRSIFDQFMNSGTLKRVRSESISVDIKPKPANIKTANWLPASKLSLTDNWSEDIQQLKTGEPVTRTITIRANGLLAAALPELKLEESDGLKQYPDKPILENGVIDSGVSSSKEIKIALIPTRAGNYKVPAISLSWFNTKTGKREVARLEETTLNVTGVANTAVNPPPVITNAQHEPVITKTTDNVPGLLNQYINASHWPWISLAFALAWLVTLVAYLRKGERAEKVKVKPSPALQPLESAVKKYCANNNTHQAKDALLAWAKTRWPEMTNASLVDIAEHTSPELAEQLQTLNNALYGAADNSWEGAKLAAAFTAFKHNKNKPERASDSALKPLYKATR
jgi:hypothetical protein